MKKIQLLIISLILLSSAAYAEKYRYFLPPSAFSASYSSGSFSSLINPVFTQRESFPFAAYSFVKEEDSEWNHFASLNILDFDFVYARYNNLADDNAALTEKKDISLYTISRGFMFDNIIGFGIGYSRTSSGYEYLDNCSGWHLGFLFRPTWFLSAGAVFREVDDKYLDGNKFRSGTYSISVRPFTDRVTLSADATLYENKTELENDYSFGIEFTGYNGLTFILKGDNDKNYTFGLTAPFSFRDRGPLLVNIDGYGGINSSRADFYSGGISFTAAGKKDSFNATVSGKPVYLRLYDSYSNENSPYSFFLRREKSFHTLLEGIERAASDNSISSLIIDIDNVSFGMAQIQEIRGEIAKFRSKGKKVYALMSYTGNREYYLASSADKIYFTPNSTFSITGLNMQLYFISGLLNKAGVKYESVSRGKYKSFNEMFTRENMSPAARENMKGILSDLNEQFVNGISESRNIPVSRVNELFAAGFYLPETAKEKGFIDEIMHRETAVSAITEDSSMVKFEDYINEAEKSREWGPVPEIAIVHVTGTIISGNGGKSAISSTTGDYDYREALEKAFESPAVKSIVIRIDSGGGSASASDFMWNYLLLMKKKYPKPVIFSFGNIAASGGYYIACTGDRIFTSPGTITGSIGVVAGKISLKELYSKLGISNETISMSEFANAFTETREMTSAEREIFQKNIDFIYERFTGRVIEGRKIPAEKIPLIAEGEVHTGKGAVENGLADEYNGLMAAINYAASMGGIENRYEIIHLPEKGGYLRGLLRSSGEESVIRGLRVLLNIAEKYSFPDEKILYMTPYIIEIK